MRESWNTSYLGIAGASQLSRTIAQSSWPFQDASCKGTQPVICSGKSDLLGKKKSSSREQMNEVAVNSPIKAQKQRPLILITEDIFIIRNLKNLIKIINPKRPKLLDVLKRKHFFNLLTFWHNFALEQLGHFFSSSLLAWQSESTWCPYLIISTPFQSKHRHLFPEANKPNQSETQTWFLRVGLARPCSRRISTTTGLLAWHATYEMRLKHFLIFQLRLAVSTTLVLFVSLGLLSLSLFSRHPFKCPRESW